MFNELIQFFVENGIVLKKSALAELMNEENHEMIGSLVNKIKKNEAGALGVKYLEEKNIWSAVNAIENKKNIFVKFPSKELLAVEVFNPKHQKRFNYSTGEIAEKEINSFENTLLKHLDIDSFLAEYYTILEGNLAMKK